MSVQFSGQANISAPGTSIYLYTKEPIEPSLLEKSIIIHHITYNDIYAVSVSWLGFSNSFFKIELSAASDHAEKYHCRLDDDDDDDDETIYDGKSFSSAVSTLQEV